MKCPMKFNNPCADADDQCDPECAWLLKLPNEERACAITVLTIKGFFEGTVIVPTYEDGE